MFGVVRCLMHFREYSGVIVFPETIAEKMDTAGENAAVIPIMVRITFSRCKKDNSKIDFRDRAESLAARIASCAKVHLFRRSKWLSLSQFMVAVTLTLIKYR